MRRCSPILRWAVAGAWLAWLAFPATPARALGLLIPTEARAEPLELRSQIMEVKVDSQAARTHIKQVFHNRYGRPIEAIYLMPIPKGAHVTDFAMEMNGKRVHGEVLEKDKARQIYTEIVRRSRDPGLLEYVDQEVFRASVFPIPPSGDQTVEITVSHLLAQENGVVEYQWPFAASRAVQARGRPTAPGEFDVKLTIDSKAPIKSVYSPTHKVSVDKKDDHTAVVRLDGMPAGDQPLFRCYYTLSEEAVGLHVLTARDAGEDGTFLVLISPSDAGKGEELPPVDFTFVFDVSGSMSEDDKIEAAKKALTYCLSNLRTVDAFRLITFATEVEKLTDEFLDATEENVKRAKNHVAEQKPRGGTNIDGALTEALARKPREGRLHTILFMTDGKPTVGTTSVDQILKNVERNNEKGLRIFVCGVGYDVNTTLLDRLSQQTRSATEYIRPKEDLELVISRLFDKVSRPVLTNLQIDWGRLKVRHVYPRELPDLFAGSQLTVFGRYENGGDTAITLAGKMGSKEVKYVYEGTFAEKEHEKHKDLETLWATRRVAYLLDQIRVNGESTELREEVVDLAKKNGIVTPYTSYLVQEDQPVVASAPAAGAWSMSGPEGAIRLREEAQRGGATQYYYGMPGRAAGPAATPAPGRPSDWAYGGAAGREARGRQDRPSEPMAIRAPVQLQPADSGQAAVELSTRLSAMKRAEVVAEREVTGAALRVIDGRTFRKTGDVWTEVIESKDPSKPPKLTTLKIKYLSDAYFDLLNRRPDLKKVFAMGEQVQFRVNDYLVVIGPEGEEKLSTERLEALRKK